MSDSIRMPPAYGSYGVNLTDVRPAGPSNPFARGALPTMSPQKVADLLKPTGTSSSEILAAHYVRKSYRHGDLKIPVLQGVELAIHEGEFVSIIGSSGCGKTTLLHLLATLDRPDAGEVCFEGARIDNLPTAGRDILRNRYIGMVCQFYHLLPELSVLENVLMPSMIGQGMLKYMASRGANRR